MQVFRFHRSQLSDFDDQHINLVYNQDMYIPFIHRAFSLENAMKQVEEKSDNYSMDRKKLVEALDRQYGGVQSFPEVERNRELLLSDRTFTVTTGHQLSLFTGPLYFAIKILHVIKLAEQLKSIYPEYNFVPVFWMATEDHDFEEVQSTSVFGKSVKWETTQKGPVGRFQLDGFEEAKEEIRAFFSRHPESEVMELLKIYSGENYAVATRKLVNALFGDRGLVVVDGDDKILKSFFEPVVRRELETEFSHAAIMQTSEQLKKEGGKIQVTPREINLFYIQDGVRSRIVREDDHFMIEEVGRFSKSELEKELSKFPERFSPNVALRPLYQEMILPNITYVGGAGEIGYWLQLKSVFDAAGVTYPMIQIRNSLAWLDGATYKKMQKIDMVLEDVFKSTDLLKREYIEEHASEEIDTRHIEEKSKELAALLTETLLQMDPSNEAYAAAEVKRLEKQIDSIQQKLMRQSKSNHEQAMKNIEFVKEKLFPGGGLQERVINFFSFCPDGMYRKRLDKLYASLNVEQNDFIVLREL